MELIAWRTQSSIRELEGVLNRIVAFADLSGMAKTKPLADAALADLRKIATPNRTRWWIWWCSPTTFRSNSCSPPIVRITWFCRVRSPCT
jgi:hypothetical protein